MWTLISLFGNQLGEDRNGQTIKACFSCGALVIFHEKHVDFHNKQLTTEDM